MKTFGSILSADIIDKIQDGLPDWMKNTIWSQSDVKNFIYRELHGRVRFPKSEHDKWRVDDYIILDTKDPDMILADTNNDRKDGVFSYMLYGLTDLSRLSLSAEKPSIAPIIARQDHADPREYLMFRVRFGKDKRDLIPKFNRHPFFESFWPVYDGEWVVFYSNGNGTRFVSTNLSNFDGHIPVNELK